MGKKVDSPIQAQIIDFDVHIEHSYHPNPHSEEAYPSDPAYGSYTSLTLISKIFSPKEHEGYTLNLEMVGEPIGPYNRKYDSTLEDWDYMKWKNDEDGLPSSIGYIGRSRNKIMEGYLQVPQTLITHSLAALQLGKKLYLAIEAEKKNGTRHVHSCSLRTTLDES